MTPLITAIVDTYNHERYIERSLSSVLDQGLSSSELEIIVVDDGSSDSTPDIIQKFVPHVRHLRKRNGGQGSAFNAGFSESKGALIAFLDGDDWWAQGKLRTVAEALGKNPQVSAIAHGYYECREQTSEMNVCTPSAPTFIDLANEQNTIEAVKLWRFLIPSALTVRRQVLDWIMPIPEEMVFMADTPLQAAAMFKGTLVLPEPLCYYRRHSHNLYAIDEQHSEKLRRKYEMTELVYSRVGQRLLELGVPQESVSALLNISIVEARRSQLSKFGGNRLKTFQTEMHAFHASLKNPSTGYRLFKYLVVGAATLALPPRLFYRARDWYAKRQLGNRRRRLFPES